MEYGLLGKKLSHSFSKEIHNKIGDYNYELIEKNEDEISDFMKKADFKAINVTIPYKETVLPYLAEIDYYAKLIGSVNTIVKRGTKLYGYNTDYIGLFEMLKRSDILPKGKNILILGTGGTSKTAYAVCKNEGAKSVQLVSRSEKADAVSYEKAYEMKETQIIINTTPCGMYPNNKAIPIEIAEFPKLEAVADVIYNPQNTLLVSFAKEKGLKATGGLYMLVSQALVSAEIFHNKKYEKELIDKIYSSLLSEKTNIVLTGMPSSGKSTIGTMLSEKMKREFVDTDTEIEKKYQMSISEIFEKYGEKRFRKMETNVIEEVSKKSGAVISTGGGAILKKENVSRLKQNGKIYFIDRCLENLTPTSDRPLSSDSTDLRKRYEERIEIYNSTADYIIENNGDIEYAVERIRKEATK